MNTIKATALPYRLYCKRNKKSLVIFQIKVTTQKMGGTMFYSCALSNGNYFLVIAVGGRIWSAKPPDTDISLIYGGKATYNLGNDDTSCVAVKFQKKDLLFLASYI